MFTLTPLDRRSPLLWYALRVYGAWLGCVALCVAGAWVWRSTLLLGYLTQGFPPRGLALFNLAITFGLGVLFLVLVVALEGCCRAWEEEGLLGPRLARVFGVGSLAIGLGLGHLAW
jgi:hypothetical protein